MGWQLIERKDFSQGSNKPFISIANDHISFNSLFTRIAQIDSSFRVRVYANPEELKVGFEFNKDDKLHSLSLSRASSSKKGEKRTGLFCAAQGVINTHSWLKSITKLPSIQRRFYDPKRENNIWVIQTCPAFEERKARETEDIPSDVQGIYRYVDETGRVVYIGRGEIKKRLKSQERSDWDFDVIEYSVIPKPDMQVHWEAYWIDKYKESNKGKLPIYNKVSGFEQKG